MEPPIINDSAFSSSSYSLSDIWPMPPPPPPPPLHLQILDASADNSTVTVHSTNHRKRKEAASTTISKHLCFLYAIPTVQIAILNLNSDEIILFYTEQSDSGSGNKHVKLTEPDASSAAGNKLDEQSAKPSEQPPKQDYIHVRARRGQATDSHSLAERFLSMKLEAVNSRLNMNPTTIECFHSKDVVSQPLDLAGMIFGSQAARGYAQGSHPSWLHMQIGGGFGRST
ncbi:hypothetical protein RIF29_06991 [Crotalaria pallida]|uniref:Uncharacterized protein n=1 Tax=Crotalaria pallida TaxID=3830 RepID=A0AAN9J421_CROPI